MWLRIETTTTIQILPEGEEDFHKWEPSCPCSPSVTVMNDCRLMISHNSYDERELFEVAYDSPLHTVRQELDC